MANATSNPFMITLPSGTKLYGITRTGYIQDGSTIKPDKPNGSKTSYFIEVPRDKWDGPSETAIQYAAPGTGAAKFYKEVAAYNVDGNGKWTAYSAAGAELKQELAKYNEGKPTQISTVVATAPQAVAKATGTSSSGLASTLFPKSSAAKLNPNDDSPTQPGDKPGDTPADKPIVISDLEPEFSSVPTTEDDPAYSNTKKAEKGGGKIAIVYPLGMRDEQDRIIFERYTYNPKKLSNDTEPWPYTGTLLSTIQLPIPSGISDTNSVEWGGANMNPIEMVATSKAFEIMNKDKDLMTAGNEALNAAKEAFRDSGDMWKYYFAQEAVGVQGLLSRASGSVLNSNLSLLFNGPSLRPFSFTFKLSPRDEKESIIVRRIIRQFKEGSAVNTSAQNFFLKAPDVFKIRYEQLNGKSKSLNQFKTCALTTVSVNYTPDGTYMTYSDGTMTSYELTLAFNELEPIYQKNYAGLGADEIGY